MGRIRFDLLGEITRKLKRLRNSPAMMRHDAGRRIDGKCQDFFRRLVRDFLDVHAAFGGHDKGDARCFTIDQRRQIELAINRRALFNVETIDLLSVRASLMRNQS